MAAQHNKTIYFHGVEIIKVSTAFLHNGCHDFMQPTGKCDHFEKSFPGGEDAFRTHCKGHLCLDGTHPNPSSCGCHGGNQYVSIENAEEAQITKLKEADQATLRRLRTPPEKTRACIGWIPCEAVAAGESRTFEAPHGLLIAGRPFTLFVQARSTTDPSRVWFLCDDVHPAANGWRTTTIGYTETHVYLRVTAASSSWPPVSAGGDSYFGWMTGATIEIRFLMELFE